MRGVHTFDNHDKTVLFANIDEGAPGWAQLQRLYGQPFPFQSVQPPLDSSFQLSDVVSTEFERRGIPSLGRYPTYHPHVTIAEIPAKEARLCQLLPPFVSQHAAHEFGRERVRGSQGWIDGNPVPDSTVLFLAIQLCSMKVDKNSGDYIVMEEVAL